MSAATDPPVDSARVEEFQEHGVTLLRGVFGDWIDRLRRGVERNLADPAHTPRDTRRTATRGNSSAAIATGSASPSSRISSATLLPLPSPAG